MGVSGNSQRRFGSEADAWASFFAAQAAGHVHERARGVPVPVPGYVLEPLFCITGDIKLNYSTATGQNANATGQ